MEYELEFADQSAKASTLSADFDASVSCLSSQGLRVASSDRPAGRPHPGLGERKRTEVLRVRKPHHQPWKHRGDLLSGSGATTRQQTAILFSLSSCIAMLTAHAVVDAHLVLLTLLKV